MHHINFNSADYSIHECSIILLRYSWNTNCVREIYCPTWLYICTIGYFSEFILPRRQRTLLSSTICVNKHERKISYDKISSYTALMNRYMRIQNVYLLQTLGEATSVSHQAYLSQSSEWHSYCLRHCHSSPTLGCFSRYWATLSAFSQCLSILTARVFILR